MHMTESFAEQTEAWGMSSDYLEVIPNWGALEEIEVCGHQNEWCKENINSNLPVVLNSGTLGLKHNPDLLLRVASDFAA